MIYKLITLDIVDDNFKFHFVLDALVLRFVKNPQIKLITKYY